MSADTPLPERLPEPRSGKIVVVVVLLAATALIVASVLVTKWIRVTPEPAALYPEPPTPLPLRPLPVTPPGQRAPTATTSLPAAPPSAEPSAR